MFSTIIIDLVPYRMEDNHRGFCSTERWASMLRWVVFGSFDEVVVWGFGRFRILE
jgi:hypothetical protein